MEKSCIWNFKPVERDKQLPKSWEEFCERFPVKENEYFITVNCEICNLSDCERLPETDRDLLPDIPTAYAVIALSQLIQLRNAFNGDWVPDWTDGIDKFTIGFRQERIDCERWTSVAISPLYFKTRGLRDEFLRNFRPLIEKLKPLYGIKEGGWE